MSQQKKAPQDLRTHFAMRAPHIPQDWFVPTMPTPRPVELPVYAPGWNEVFREQAAGLDDWLAESEVSAEVIEWARKRQQSIAAANQWDELYRRRWCTQWPWAWADAVLEEGQE